MTARLEVYPGHRFGRLVVVREGPGQPVRNKTFRRRTMICRCDCGSPDVEILLELLMEDASSGRSGTKSCGCLRREMAQGKVRATRARACRSPREEMLSRRSARWLAARVVELEAQNRSLTAEIGASLAELEMLRGGFR